MRVLIIGVGTRGDVAPYTGLGVRLLADGHEVAIAAHEPYAALVSDAGLEFRDIPGDPLPLLPAGKGGPRVSMADKARMFADYSRQLTDGIVGAVGQGADILLLNVPASAGYHVAEAMGIPSMGVHLQPIEPTGDFPPVVGAFTRSLGRWGNRASARLAFAMPSPAHAGSAKRLRAALGLAPMSSSAVYRRREATRWPVLHGFSPLVLPRPSDWRAGLEVTGYWWPAPRSWQPSTQLGDFLESGPPPVFIGLGSLGGSRAERFTDLAVTALRRAKLRGVLQTGLAGPSGDDVLGVGDVPHDWLFRRVAAVAHHAGCGTTAAGLRAGVPAVGLPAMADQPLWASRLAALGVGPDAIPLRHLTAERLADALKAAVDEPAYRLRAGELAHHLAAEDGVGAAARAVSRVLAGQ
ncbi:glycosyltransferase [Nonomuraea sp. LPB2021202275-12-8]|uniref:glycosyltransferase n=1 Tax=Nonomuraea sp. LPB2021202275-12-8 TaxID=3120159 RepID=UPI00300CB6F3